MSNENNHPYGLPPVPKRANYSDITADDLVFALFNREISDSQNPDIAMAEEDMAAESVLRDIEELEQSLDQSQDKQKPRPSGRG